MLQAIKSMAFRYNRYMTYMGRKRALEILLNSSDRMLEDAGFSRELLEQGVHAWPWKSESDEQQLHPIDFNELESNRTVLDIQAIGEHRREGLDVARDYIDDEASRDRSQSERDKERRVA